MIENQFLSYLVGKSEITPEQFRIVSKLAASPRYFGLQALWLKAITPEQYEKLAGAAGKAALPEDFGKFLLNKNIISAEAFEKLKEEMRDGSRLIGQVIADAGIMDSARLKRTLKQFTEELEDGAAAPDVKLRFFLAFGDEQAAGELRASLEADGHEVSLFSHTFEAVGAAAAVKPDIILSDLGSEGFDGMMVLGQALRRNAARRAAVFSPLATDFAVPAELEADPRFSIEHPEGMLESVRKLAKRVASETAKNRPATATQQSPAKAGTLSEWMQAVSIKYEPDGVTLYVDRTIAPAVADRGRMSSTALEAYREFHEAVLSRVRAMRIKNADEAMLEVAVWYPWGAPVKIAPPQEQEKDAEAELSLSPDGNNVLLAFEPPKGKGKNPSKARLIQQIKSLGPEMFVMEDVIERVLASKSTLKAIPVAEKRDGAAEIIVSKDKSEAFLILMPPYGGKLFTAGEVFEALEKRGINYGLDRELAEQACYTGLWNRKLVVARGKAVQNGNPGRIRFIPRGGGQAPAEEPEKKDLRTVISIDKVSAGEMILAVDPPTEGEPGISVYGDTILPEPGKPATIAFSKSAEKGADLILGENLELVENGTIAVSRIDGVVYHEGKRVGVRPVFEVGGDVDYSVGNLDISGDLLIKGSVLSRFIVKASGNIYVMGSVEDAIVESTGGSIFVEQGIFGHTKAVVYAKMGVEALCIDRANVFSLGHVRAKRSITHSLVTAYRIIEVGDNDGVVMGGALKAGILVSASKLGSPAGTPTLISIGSQINMAEEMQAARIELLSKIAVSGAARAGEQEEEQQQEEQTAAQAQVKYDGCSIKTYDRCFIDWMDNWLVKYRDNPPVYLPGESSAQLKVVGANFTYPGVSLKIRTLTFNVKNSMAGKRAFKIVGDNIIETT